MAMYKEEQVLLGIPLTGGNYQLTKTDVLQALEGVPDNAVLRFTGYFDSFDVMFTWKRQLTPEEEEAERERRLEEQREIEEAEKEDREAGF